MRQPGPHPGASHSRAQRPETEGTIGQAAVGDGDGGATSQDAGRLSSVPRGYPRWPPAVVESFRTPESRMMRKYQVRFGGGRMEKVLTCTLSGSHEWNLASRLPYIIWGFQHVAGFRRRHVGASIQDAWTYVARRASARRSTPTPADDRTVLLRATSQELGTTREAVVDTVAQRLDLSQQAGRRGVHAGGAVRDESPFRLGLRARTDPTQSAHALAGWTVHPRSRRQPPPDHGPLTLVIAVRV